MSGSLVRSLLPWNHPFLMVDDLVESVPHERVVTCKRVTADDPSVGEPDADGAFPSVLVIEGLSQSAALLFQLSYGPMSGGAVPLLGHLEAAVHGGASAGDTIHFTVRAIKMTRSSGLFAGVAAVGGRTIAEADLGFAVASGERP